MKVLEKIEKAVAAISRAAGWLSYLGYALIIAITVLDVILRKAINRPILGAYEMVQYLLLVSVFTSFAYCQTMRGHIQVTMLLRVLPKRAVFIISTLTSLLTTVIMAVIGYAAAQQALYAARLSYQSDVLQFPIAPFIWIECAGMMIFALTCLMDVINSAVAIFNTEKQEQLLAEWL